MSTTQESRLELLVHRMTWEAEDVLSLELVDPDGRALPPWEAGAHLDLHLGPQTTRQYSLCGDPEDRGRYRIAVLKEPASRGGSAHVHAALRPGARVTAKGPRNHFALADADSYLFIAGGIGITPILAQARQAGRQGRRWQLWHGGRKRSSMAFGAELAALAALGGEVTLHPQDEAGLLDLDRILDRAGTGALVYCCGPEPLLAAVEAACTERGIRERLHTERFAAVKQPAPDTGEAAFEVRAARSGVTVQVGADQSIVDALEAAGVAVETSCREGICGTCETKVLDGRPDHRDMLLSAEEQAAGGSMMVCVSRCASPCLVLDL